ncbi:hypothetical protein [Xylocopilactobacillus apicola]|uniref:Uncharacterized protein n=1 Tax=Xylocopilactobacillus apicola TaxID=2932184 RepID=A0AAU9DL39_9LACO|nr:hypothetical protein [Xylocopilactobacillus apicola]BDR57582.1 hypothetical protein XA3_00230 [Xylocopilactobacillus apicola]
MRNNTPQTENYYHFKDTGKINNRAPKKIYQHWEFWLIIILTILAFGPAPFKKDQDDSVHETTSSSDSKSESSTAFDEAKVIAQYEWHPSKKDIYKNLTDPIDKGGYNVSKKEADKAGNNKL